MEKKSCIAGFVSVCVRRSNASAHRGAAFSLFRFRVAREVVQPPRERLRSPPARQHPSQAPIHVLHPCGLLLLLLFLRRLPRTLPTPCAPADLTRRRHARLFPFLFFTKTRRKPRRPAGTCAWLVECAGVGARRATRVRYATMQHVSCPALDREDGEAHRRT